MPREIPLTRGKVAIVDDADYEWLNQWKWHYSGDYAVRLVWMHREIMSTPQGMETDHINNNGVDNRRCNLRICSRAQNVRNVRKRTGCSSQYIGVYWYAPGQKWGAKIGINRGRVFLGYFDDEQEAARARDAAALKYHGEFAQLNFP